VVYLLKPGVTTIGRLANNDVVVEGPHVSRRHCAILAHEVNGCVLYDLGARNGTRVNGLKVNGSTQLVSGDEIRIAHRLLVFRSGPTTNTTALLTITGSERNAGDREVPVRRQGS
jgi:pSer/pThr/pTyr-binding forkhead associated (FHA) protein